MSTPPQKLYVHMKQQRGDGGATESQQETEMLRQNNCWSWPEQSESINWSLQLNSLFPGDRLVWTWDNDGGG